MQLKMMLFGASDSSGGARQRKMPCAILNSETSSASGMEQ